MAKRPKYDHPTVFNYLQDYGCDLETRRIFNHHWMGPSEDAHEIGIEYVARNLLFLDKSEGRIELWINNPGGWLHEMWGIIDIMTVCNNPVDTIVYGNASSAACLLVASGTGVRYTLPRSSFMWHAGTTDIDQGMHWVDAKDRMAWEIVENERWIKAMAQATSPVKCRSMKAKIAFWSEHAKGGGEKWLDAEGMLANGVVDHIWKEPMNPSKERKKG